MPFSIRPYKRDDRSGVTALVNAHAGAVLPGAVVSMNAVLSQLEREPAEMIVDPWVRERYTLVAEQRGRIVAAAHLLTYGGSADMNPSYEGLGELRWFLFWPWAPFWPDSREPAAALFRTSIAKLREAGSTTIALDGSLPAPGCYGIPEAWPHIISLGEEIGFAPTGQTELVYLASVSSLLGRPAPSLEPHIVRTLGTNGTRLTATLPDGEAIGYIEVEVREEANVSPRFADIADIGNLHVAEPWQRRGVATWLISQVASWLVLGGITRLMAYALDTEGAVQACLTSSGFEQISRTRRGWQLPA